VKYQFFFKARSTVLTTTNTTRGAVSKRFFMTRKLLVFFIFSAEKCTMDAQRQTSQTAIEIDPKSQSSNDSKPQLCRKMSSSSMNEIVSPLKRKSTSPIEITSLTCDAKRRRHHRRKSNKKWRPKSLSSEISESVGLKAPATTASEKCQKNRKMCAKLSNSPNQLSWKRKRKQNYYNNFFSNQNQNSFKAIPKALSTSQLSQARVGIQRLPGACGGPGKKRTNVVLRPTKVPLLNAPRNSTQFIIDDHESSDLVRNRTQKKL
jgi:hypothetical protein